MTLAHLKFKFWCCVWCTSKGEKSLTTSGKKHSLSLICCLDYRNKVIKLSSFNLFTFRFGRFWHYYNFFFIAAALAHG